MQDAVSSHPELRLLGEPTFCFAFTSDEFDIYHVNDAMAARLALQRPAVPRRPAHGRHPPQPQPGVVEAFATDLAAAIEYAKDPDSPTPRSAAVYGASGGTEGADPQMADFLLTLLLNAFTDGAGAPPDRLKQRRGDDDPVTGPDAPGADAWRVRHGGLRDRRGRLRTGAAKALVDRGIDFDWFEKGSMVGGLWRIDNDNGGGRVRDAAPQQLAAADAVPVLPDARRTGRTTPRIG